MMSTYTTWGTSIHVDLWLKIVMVRGCLSDQANYDLHTFQLTCMNSSFSDIPLESWITSTLESDHATRPNYLQLINNQLILICAHHTQYYKMQRTHKISARGHIHMAQSSNHGGHSMGRTIHAHNVCHILITWCTPHTKQNIWNIRDISQWSHFEVTRGVPLLKEQPLVTQNLYMSYSN